MYIYIYTQPPLPQTQIVALVDTRHYAPTNIHIENIHTLYAPRLDYGSDGVISAVAWWVWNRCGNTGSYVADPFHSAHAQCWHTVFRLGLRRGRCCKGAITKDRELAERRQLLLDCLQPKLNYKFPYLRFPRALLGDQRGSARPEGARAHNYTCASECTMHGERTTDLLSPPTTPGEKRVHAVKI